MKPNSNYFENVLLTGCTGLVGSHLLFELLALYLKQKLDGSIYLLVRSTPIASGNERIIEMLKSSFAPDYIQKVEIEKLLQPLVIIESDILAPDLSSDLSSVDSKPLTVIHSAASCNLISTSTAKEEVDRVNIEGTQNLLNAVSALPLKKIVYVSTAFASGTQSNTIPNSFDQLTDRAFRNPYEKSKADTEEIIKNFCKKYDTPYFIARPSVVCGRLLDTPLYCVSKYDVFYGAAGFFYKMKRSMEHEEFRMFIHMMGTLNIVPVDFVAKVICECIPDTRVQELNIINSNPPKHNEYIPAMLAILGISGCKLIDYQPEALTRFEKLYYKTAGKAFEPYVTAVNQEYCVGSILPYFNKYPYPSIISQAEGLLEYAIERAFTPGYN